MAIHSEPCRAYYCKHYYGQCPWERNCRLDANDDNYCEDYISICDLDYDDKIE